MVAPGVSDPDVANLDGNVMTVTTGSAPIVGGFGGAASPGASDWRPRRIGADPPAGLVSLRTDVEACILTACGLGGWVSSISDGQRSREGFRQFASVTLQPLARIVAAELSRKLEQSIMLDFEALNAADVAGKARAYGVLRKAEMPDAQARAIVGFDGEAD